MHPFGPSRELRVLLGVAVLSGSLALTAAAQSPGPSDPLPPSPPPSPAATNDPNGWLPVRFVGGSPDVMTVTSDCGIPGVDTFHLTGVGPGQTAWFDVALTAYDATNMRYTGHQVGQVFGPNAVEEIDGNVTLAYVSDIGNWLLKGEWIHDAPVESCVAPPSPPG